MKGFYAKFLYQLKLIKWRMENDPLKKCINPCCHIDGPLCSVKYCGERRLWETPRPEFKNERRE